MLDQIEGILENIIFFNEDNGFVIGVVDVDNKPVYVKGYIPFVNEGEKYRFEGKWTNHPTYGEQFD